jgi:predicted restriction endonuclease
LDVYNGLLLAPHVDALFDGGWISFDRLGRVLVSSELPGSAAGQLGVSAEWSVKLLTEKHQEYLDYHRQKVFRAGAVHTGNLADD